MSEGQKRLPNSRVDDEQQPGPGGPGHMGPPWDAAADPHPLLYRAHLHCVQRGPPGPAAILCSISKIAAGSHEGLNGTGGWRGRICPGN